MVCPSNHPTLLHPDQPSASPSEIVMTMIDHDAQGPSNQSPYATSSAPAPSRSPGSIRRTSTLDADWPEGVDFPIRLIGRARDAITTSPFKSPIIAAEDSLSAKLTTDRMITSIEAHPFRPGLAALVADRAGNRLRAAIAEAVPEERRRATPLYLLLDDIAGVSLVAPWTLSHWSEAWLARMQQHVRDHDAADVCIGFRQGSPALGARRHRVNFGAVTPALGHPNDPDGWPPFNHQSGPGFRRARWIDVMLGDVIEVGAGFQDSASTPSGDRRVVHEYRVSAQVDPETLAILELEAHPYVLPYAECGAAVATTRCLIGSNVGSLRETVPMALRGPRGCTHLNDAFRALAEVPALAEHLRLFRSA